MKKYIVLLILTALTTFSGFSQTKVTMEQDGGVYKVVCKINGVPIKPYWCDTVALPAGGTASELKSITFRMRFDDFTGPYVMHCQMLQHSDLGMIQRVTVVPV